MNRKEKIKLLGGIASGTVKVSDLKQYFREPIGVLFEKSKGVYEDMKGKVYSEDELQKYKATQKVYGILVIVADKETAVAIMNLK